MIFDRDYLLLLSMSTALLLLLWLLLLLFFRLLHLLLMLLLQLQERSVHERLDCRRYFFVIFHGIIHSSIEQLQAVFNGRRIDQS